MSALSTLFPVFFMIILGMIARIKNFISPKQKEGANHIVFNVLFPILIRSFSNIDCAICFSCFYTSYDFR